MFSQIFFIVLGLLMMYVGLQQGDAVNLIVGGAIILVTAERVYHLKTGKLAFGLPDYLPKK